MFEHLYNTWEYTHVARVYMDLLRWDSTRKISVSDVNTKLIGYVFRNIFHRFCLYKCRYLWRHEGLFTNRNRIRNRRVSNFSNVITTHRNNWGNQQNVCRISCQLWGHWCNKDHTETTYMTKYAIYYWSVVSLRWTKATALLGAVKLLLFLLEAVYILHYL